MPEIDRAILSTLIYYDLLDRPLTELEIYKYLLGQNQGVSFFDFKKTLEGLAFAQKIHCQHGLCFLPDRENIIGVREKRLKLAQLKWRKLRRLAKILATVPFLRMAAATGSLTACNTRLESDFDLLVVTQKNRLWLARIFITALTALLGVRRHGQKTQDRICLNCYLTEDRLEIEPQAKPRDAHSAQEYGRLTPIIEISEGIYSAFLLKNNWLKNFLKFYPWLNSNNAKKIKPIKFLSAGRLAAEWLLSGLAGDWLEKKFGLWQTKRINQKIQNKPADQIYISDHCLMFHPQSKSYPLTQLLQERVSRL